MGQIKNIKLHIVTDIKVYHHMGVLYSSYGEPTEDEEAVQGHLNQPSTEEDGQDLVKDTPPPNDDHALHKDSQHSTPIGITDQNRGSESSVDDGFDSGSSIVDEDSSNDVVDREDLESSIRAMSVMSVYGTPMADMFQQDPRFAQILPSSNLSSQDKIFFLIDNEEDGVGDRGKDLDDDGSVFDEYDMMNIKEDFNKNNNNDNNKQDIRCVVNQESVHNNVDHEYLINLIHDSSINQRENGLVTSEERDCIINYEGGNSSIEKKHDRKEEEAKNAAENTKEEQEAKARKNKEAAQNAWREREARENDRKLKEAIEATEEAKNGQKTLEAAVKAEIEKAVGNV